MRCSCVFGLKAAVAVLFLAGASAVSAAVPEAHPLKVLSIGNSFSIKMHRVLPPVAAALGRRVDICTMYIGGCSLEQHCENLHKTEAAPYQIDWTFSGKAANRDVAFWPVLNVCTNAKSGRIVMKANIPQMLKSEKWDAVVIQQASHESWKPESYHPFGDELVKAIRAGAPQAKIVVQETWSYVTCCKRYAKWGIDQAQMYERLHKCYADFARPYGFEILPVGTAVQMYRRHLPVRSSDTEIGGDPVGTSPKGDTIHMNVDGNYLQALVWAGGLLAVDVSRCAYAPEGTDPKRAELMRRCACEALGSPAREVR